MNWSETTWEKLRASSSSCAKRTSGTREKQAASKDGLPAKRKGMKTVHFAFPQGGAETSTNYFTRVVEQV